MLIVGAIEHARMNNVCIIQASPNTGCHLLLSRTAWMVKDRIDNRADDGRVMSISQIR